MSVKVYEKAKLIMEVYGSLNWENAEELDLNRCCTTFLDKLKLQDFSVDHGVSICSSPSCSVSNYAIVLKITVLTLRICEGPTSRRWLHMLASNEDKDY